MWFTRRRSAQLWFTAGVLNSLVMFYVFQLVIVVIGLVALAITKNQLRTIGHC